jgi:hypothetical protein
MLSVRPSWYARQSFWDPRFTFRREHRLRARSQTRFLLCLNVLELRIATAVYNVPADLELAAAISAADTNGDAQNTIELAPGTYLVIGQQIQAVPAKTLVIAGQGSGVIPNPTERATAF